MDLTQENYLNMLVQQMELDKTVVRLLTEILVDNDEGNSLINENTINNIINKLDPLTWENYEEVKQEIFADERELIRRQDMEQQSLFKPLIKEVFRETNNPPFPARFVDLLKTLVESDLGPKPARQKQVIDRFFQMFEDESVVLNKIILRDEQHSYQNDVVLTMFDEFRDQVFDDKKNVGKNFFPNSDDEKEFNFHLQLMDLLGMCAKGRNITTTNFCRGLYDDINSLTVIMSGNSYPLCIRTTMTRFIHGVYFSDPKHQVSLDDESQNLWDFFEYNHFKGAFMNIIKDLQKLIELFKQKERIESEDYEREKKEDEEEDEKLEDKRRQKQEKKQEMKVRRSSAVESFLIRRLQQAEVESDEEEVAGEMDDVLFLDEISLEAKELNVYLQAESYEDYVFDVLLPFLTDLLKCNVELCNVRDLNETKYLEEFNWSDYKDLEVPNFIEDMMVGDYSLANLFRVIVFHVLQINTHPEVSQKENWREGVSDFLVETLNFLTDHFNDSNTILDEAEEAAQAMQVIIITNIHKIKSETLQNIKIQGDMDMNSELIRDIKKKKMIQDKALPIFVKVALKASTHDKNRLLTASLRQKFGDDDILPEFSRYVKLMEKKLSLFIRWSDNELSQLKQTKKKNKSKKQKRNLEKLEAYMDETEGAQEEDKEEELSEDDLERDEEDAEEEENDEESDSDDEEQKDSEPILPQQRNRTKSRSAAVYGKEATEMHDLFFEFDENKTPVRRTKQYITHQLSNEITSSRHPFSPKGDVSSRKGGVSRRSTVMQSETSPDRTRTISRSQSFVAEVNLEGDEMDVDSLKKIDKKDFNRWTGFGGVYLAKLIEILTDLTSEGTEQGDAFHIRMMQALLIQHDVEELQKFPLNRKQEAMSELGVSHMVMMLMSKARNPKQLSQYVKTILPEVVSLGNNLLALGNKIIQNTFLKQYEKAIDQMLPSQYFLISIRELIREARNNIANLSKDEFLRSMIQNLLQFVKDFCEGHFIDSQIFLLHQKTSHNVDVITEISSFLYAICEKIKSNIVYVDSADFIEKMCPSLISDPYKKKRLIAWYKHTCEIPDIQDINLAAQVYRTLTETIQGPCEENQRALVKSRICRSVQDLLEYIESFFYRKTTHSNQLKWSGHGIGMYYAYLENQPSAGDIDATQMARFCKLMEKIKLDPDNDPTGQHILIRHHGPEYHDLIDGMDNLEQNILIFMTSLLEGAQSSQEKGIADTSIPKYIVKAIDEDVMIHSLHNYYKALDLSKAAFLELELAGEEHGQWIKRQLRKVFLYYSFMTLLTDKDEQSTVALKKKLMYWESTYNIDMSQIVGRIEINNQYQQLEVIYFPLPPIIRIYWQMPAIREYRNQLIDKITRDNPEEKVNDFQDQSEELIWYMEILKSISMSPREFPVVGHAHKFIANQERIWSKITNMLTILINIFMIYFLVVDDDDIISDPSWGETAFSICGFTHFAFMTIYWLSFLLKKGRFEVSKRLHRNDKRTVKVPKSVVQFLEKVKKRIIACLDCIFCRKKYEQQSGKSLRRKRQKNVYIHIDTLWWTIWYLFTSGGVQYTTLCLLMSLLGATVSTAFFCFHLIMLISDNSLIQQVVNSVRYNIDQLLASLLLTVILLYWYSVLAFNVDKFRNAYDFEGKMVCDSLASCFQTHFDMGLTVNPFWIEEPIPWEGIPVNLSYFIIINLIITSVIDAIIIDTFSQLRQEMIERQADTEDRCFICNIDRDDFDRLGLSFYRHIKREHHMWNYLFFRAYLDELDETEMTGQESYVFEEMRNNSIKFYPIKKALVIEGRNKVQKDLPTLFMRVDSLERQLVDREEGREDLMESLGKILGRVEHEIASKT